MVKDDRFVLNISAKASAKLLEVAPDITSMEKVLIHGANQCSVSLKDLDKFFKDTNYEHDFLGEYVRTDGKSKKLDLDAVKRYLALEESIKNAELEIGYAKAYFVIIDTIDNQLVSGSEVKDVLIWYQDKYKQLKDEFIEKRVLNITYQESNKALFNLIKSSQINGKKLSEFKIDSEELMARVKVRAKKELNSQ